jgi:hypothetical protein
MSNSAVPATVLRPGIALAATEEVCTVYAGGERTDVAFSPAFPTPRAERVLPGHLVAIADTGGAEVVVWRWFDAVVLEQLDGGRLRLWEPGHGEVVGQARNPRHSLAPGSRAYLSAGLEGAQWWVAGPVVELAEAADVELAEVQRFLSQHGVL